MLKYQKQEKTVTKHKNCVQETFQRAAVWCEACGKRAKDIHLRVRRVSLKKR